MPRGEFKLFTDPCEIKPFLEEKEKQGMVLHERKDQEYEIGWEDRIGWHGTTLDKAFERIENGCKACAKLVEDTVIPVIQKQSNWGKVYKIDNDVVGPAIDPGLLSMGIPECCVIPEMEKTHSLGDAGIDIIVNLVVSAGVSTEVIRNRGILACTVALIAERMEINTRIVAGYTVDGKGGWFRKEGRNDFAVVIKEYSRPLDLPRIGFFLISPASSRRIGFSLFDAVDAQSKDNYHYLPANTEYKVDRNQQIVIDHGLLRKSMLDPEVAVENALEILRSHGVIGGNIGE